MLSDPPPAGFNLTAPPIVVRSTPTISLFVNGDAVAADVPGTGLKLLVNANWPVFTDGSSYYLLYKEQWLSSSDLKGGWSSARSLPAGFVEPCEQPFPGDRTMQPRSGELGEQSLGRHGIPDMEPTRWILRSPTHG